MVTFLLRPASSRIAPPEQEFKDTGNLKMKAAVPAFFPARLVELKGMSHK
jgi:hypothetical protein